MKRFLGWEPTTFFSYDDEDRMVASKPEVEWDETQQNYMLALADYRATLCPVCGGPMADCTAPENERKFKTDLPTRCHRQTATLAAQEGIEKSSFPGALMFRTVLMD